MDTQPYDPGRKRSVWFSPLLLAVALSPVFLQTSTPLSCKSGDTTLSELAVTVSGQNQITFVKTQRSYDVWLPLSSTTALVRAIPTDPKAQIWVDVYIGANRNRIMNGVVGGGQVAIPLQPDLNTLQVWVRPPGGASGTYNVAIQVGCSHCADGNVCTADTCDPVAQKCVHPPVADGAVCDFDGLPGICVAGICQEDLCANVDCQDGNECTADVCDPTDGTCTNDPVANGASCDLGGFPGLCQAGACGADDRSWRTEELLESDDIAQARAPSVAVDPSGNAIAVWSRVDGALYSTWANHYIPSEGWGSPVSLGPANYHGGDPGPRIGMASNGSAVAIWRRNCGTGAAVYQPEIGWGAPENIQTPGVCTLRTDLAVNAAGDAIAVWENSLGELYSVWANRFTPSAGWGTPERISDYGSTLSPRVAINSDGNAIVVWEVDDTEMWANRFTPSAGWGTPERIATTSAFATYRSVVAVNERGDAVAAWTLWGPNEVWANWFTVATGWGSAERISDVSGSGTSGPAAVIDSRGRAMVLYDGVFANRFIPNSGWGIPERISSEVTHGIWHWGHGVNPQMALDLNDHVTAVWAGWDGTTQSVFASRWTSVGGWEVPQVIENLAVDLSLSNPSVAVSAYGNAVAAWDAPNDFSSVWANRFE